MVKCYYAVFWEVRVNVDFFLNRIVTYRLIFRRFYGNSVLLRLRNRAKKREFVNAGYENNTMRLDGHFPLPVQKHELAIYNKKLQKKNGG